MLVKVTLKNIEERWATIKSAFVSVANVIVDRVPRVDSTTWLTSKTLKRNDQRNGVKVQEVQIGCYFFLAQINGNLPPVLATPQEKHARRSS